ncbi:MAG: SHOCT domain-containing protein [Clostridia bacterium]|nr:SHOCT domain-containing protein [Clostridia bacterium]
MYNNIGGKIKGLAVFLAWVGIILSILSGIGILSTTSKVGYYSDSDLISGAGSLVGLITIVVGCLLSWVGSLVLYGFGQLVENSDKQAYELSRLGYLLSEDKKNQSRATIDPRKLRLYELLDKGVITPEEFSEKINNL